MTTTDMDSCFGSVFKDMMEKSTVNLGANAAVKKHWKEQIDERPATKIDWKKIPVYKAELYEQPEISIEDLKAKKKEPELSNRFGERSHFMVQIAPKPFDMGSVRVVYHCRVHIDREWKAFIAKQFMKPELQTKKNYLAQLEDNQVPHLI
jgi:hypothetical protein